MLRTPSVTDGTGGARSEKQAAERGQMVKTADQVAQLAFENGLKVSPAVEASLMPTPTLGHIRNHDEPIENYLERREKADSGEYRGMPGISLGVAVRMETTLLSTPTTQDSSGKCRDHGGDLLHDVTCGCERSERRLMPTPKALDGVKGNLKTSEERLASGHQVDLPNVAIDLIGTPRATASESSSAQVANGATKGRIEDQVLTTNWGKFEPAIRRWEQLTRPAPAPTLPDGKDGAHRLSSKFTEWMMGLPDGWITGHGLKRNDELKMAGNGVVPQQAELALRMLLGADIPKEVDKGTLFPTPTVSDTFTDSLKSSQQKPGSMHSVTLPQAVMWTVGVELEKATSESL